MKRFRLNGEFVMLSAADYRDLMMELDRLREAERLRILAIRRVGMPSKTRADERTPTLEIRVLPPRPDPKPS